MSSKNPYKTGGMFEGASYLIFANAKQLRKNMTVAEKSIWVHLKAGVLGCKFRRQHPISIYIADFYCHKVKLIIEIDGEIHNDPGVRASDEQRENDLRAMGYNIIRFSNNEVMREPETVLKKIVLMISELNNINKHYTLPSAESKSPL